MAFNTQLNKIRRLTALIQHKATGAPDALAERLNISQSTLFALLKYLREDFDAPIYYDVDRESYCFSREVYFFVGFSEKKL